MAKVALLFGLLFSSVFANGIFSGPVFAQTVSQLSTIAVDPQQSLVTIKDNGTISLDVTNVVNLFDWQVALEYNATVLNLTELWIPEDNVFAGHDIFSPDPMFGKDVISGSDYAIYSSTLLGSDSVNVSAGVLFRANFTGLNAGVTTFWVATLKTPVSTDFHTTFYSELQDSEGAANGEELPFVAESGVAFVGLATFLTLATTAGGTTDPVPDTYMFLNNSQVSVTALPQLGYDFFRWEFDGANMSSVNPFEVTMDVNHTLNAVFLPHVPVTWIVNKSGPANFTSIQEAINSQLVEYSDIVFVKSGIYYEQVGMTKELTLV